jgi:hypothetical protein
VVYFYSYATSKSGLRWAGLGAWLRDKEHFMTTSASRKSRTARRGKATSRSSLTWWLIGAGVFFVALIGFIVWSNSRPTRVAPVELDLPAGWVEGQRMGNPEATVVVQAWEDFLCPHCQDWTAQIEPRLIEEYVKTGKIRFEYHFLPLQGFEPGSSMGAQAGLCAADQNAFWPYHDLLFATAGTRGQTGFTLERLVKNAEELGLDANEFRLCLSSQRHRSTIDASLQEAAGLQLTATPSLLINDKRMGNPFDYATIQTEIDQLVASE